MPPTIQQGAAPIEKRPPKPGERRSELICKVKYCNTLPDIPFDLKFISYPFESTRFIQYNPTSLERNYRYEVLTEHDLGVNIDLINRDIYAVEPGVQLDPADEKLLEEDILTPQDSKRSRHHARNVSWLRRTEYISTEQTRFQPQTMDKVEAKVGYNIKMNLKNETLYMDRESQIKAIEKTFADSKIPIDKHYSKPGVHPVEVLPVHPDFKLWKYPCAQVIFDSDPAPVGKQVPAQIEEMSQAMIRGVMDESGEQFVAYFLPTEETLNKRKEDFINQIEYQEDEEYEYKMAREYNWNVKSKASKGYEENYFLVVREDGIYYNELETRVRLSKRRQKMGQTSGNTRLIVHHRTMNAPEFRMQRFREKQLEPPGDDDEEMDLQEEQENEIQEEAGEGSDKETSDKENSDKEGEKEGSDKEGEKEGSDKEGEKEGSDKEGEKEGSDKEEKEPEEPAKSGSEAGSRSSSRSSNKSGSKSRSPSRSRSRSRSKSRSRSRSKSKSKSRSVSKSPSRSKSRSRSKSPSKSKSRSRSRSKSPSRSRSASRSKSRSKSRSRSKSKSASRSRSASRSPSRHSSKSRSRSRSPSKSAQSGSGSGSGSSGSDSD